MNNGIRRITILSSNNKQELTDKFSSLLDLEEDTRKRILSNYRKSFNMNRKRCYPTKDDPGFVHKLRRVKKI